MNAAITGTLAATVLATTVAGSVAIAFALEWMCLRGVMALMPARQLNTRQMLFRDARPTRWTHTQLFGSGTPGQKH
ncbi:MAG: hypothetical protein ACYDCD_06790 [Candidatus Acidiferrales bacterium]